MSRTPGFPEHGGGQSQAHRLVGDETEIRRSILLLAAGIAVTFALFLALPMMQVASPPITPPLKPVDPFARPVPAKFEPPPTPKTPDKPVEDPPILKPDFKPIPYDQLVVPVNPTGTGPRIPAVVFRPEDITTDIFDLIELDRVPTPIHTVAPRVPRGVRHDGTVVLEFIVTPQGGVTGIKVVSSSDRAFDQPAVFALGKWRFEPGVKNNTPVSTRMRLPIRFNVGN